jgi:hypothetical protein
LKFRSRSLTHQTGEGTEIFPGLEESFEMEELPVIACSLSAADLPERRARWTVLMERALAGRSDVANGLRLSFRGEPGVEEELRALAELERDCCGFAAFEVSASRGRVRLDVTSSGAGVAAVRGLFL